MNDLHTPLSERELVSLDELLLNRPGLEDSGGDTDEGIIGVSELDGFLTAIVSGPEMVPPSQWIPALWGEVEPVWESVRDFERILGLIMRHMNVIAGMLTEAPEEFEPMFSQRTVDGKDYTIVDDWCSGYMRGAWIWAEADPESFGLLRPIFLFGSEKGWTILEDLDDATQDEHRAKVAPACREIHAFWLSQRSVSTLRRKGVKVGRNDPCPCGSGRKYKQCCV